MRLCLLLTYFFVSLQSFSQYTRREECRSYIEEKVVFEKKNPVKSAPDSSANSSTIKDYAQTCSTALKAENPSFEIQSFMISGETSDGDIFEAVNYGSCLNILGLTAYRTAAPGTDIYFYCIRALHKNGKVYTLKPFTIKH